MSETLQELSTIVCEDWPFNKATYPRLDGPGDHHALVHAVLHLAKSSGKVAAAVEPYDHGKEVDRDALRDQLGYTLVNLLRTADLAGIAPDELVGVVTRWREARH